VKDSQPGVIDRRWEQGLPHHPLSKRIFEVIRRADWESDEDYFCWKSGGDGDNGECLMYLLDEFIEVQGEAVVRDLLREASEGYCCQMMRDQLESECPDHGKNCPNQVVRRWEFEGQKRLTLRAENATWDFQFCPWCGSRVQKPDEEES